MERSLRRESRFKVLGLGRRRIGGMMRSNAGKASSMGLEWVMIGSGVSKKGVGRGRRMG